MPSIPSRPRAAIYVPHGAIPDRRGYAPAIVAWNFARYLREFDPFVLCAREHHAADHEFVHGISVQRFHEGRLYRRLFKKITRLDPYPLHRRAAAMLRHQPWDLLHAHQLEFPVDDFLRRTGTRKPVLLHAHVTTNQFDPARGVADRYIAASEHIRRRLIEAKGYPAERLVVVRNGVDVELFKPAVTADRRQLRLHLDLPQDATVLVFFGRREEVKGFHVWLRALAALTERHKDLYAVAIGPERREALLEPTYAERRQLQQQLDARGRFRSLPAVPHPELVNYLRAADVALLPSLVEPQGMAMIEAMASGCVTVSSKVGGIPESIRHGETGYLLERPEDIDEVIATCEKVLNQSTERAVMREKARADIVARFSVDVVARELEQVYREVLPK